MTTDKRCGHCINFINCYARNKSPYTFMIDCFNKKVISCKKFKKENELNIIYRLFNIRCLDTLDNNYEYLIAKLLCLVQYTFLFLLSWLGFYVHKYFNKK